jgi:hypothetical protein
MWSVRPVVLPFAAAITVSAFLLFSIQPLVGRLALPAFGGAPGTWAVILVTFQAALLAGYAYAHVSVRRLGRLGPPLHLGLVALAVGALLLAPDRLADVRDPGLAAPVDLLRLLALTIGLPAVALGATTPLLSGWLTAAAPGRSTGDPYRLYALSNLGSFAGLVAYPFVVDPLLGLAAQRSLWTAGFVVLASLLVVAAGIAWRSGRSGSETPTSGPSSASPPWGRRLRWVLLAAVPAGLLSAVTNFIATDLMAAPLLWVGPLGIYLLTLVAAFSGHLGRWPARLAWAVPVAVAVLLVPYAAPVDWPVLPLLTVEWGGLALVAFVLHGRLAADRPPADRLTEFELLLAVGGVTGGAFVGLLAPVAFPDVWEYPILLVLALAALATTEPELAGLPDPRRALGGMTRRMTAYLAVAGVLALALTLGRSVALAEASTWLLVGALVVAVAGDARVAAVVAALILAIPVLAPEPALLRDRSFFAVSEVVRFLPLDGRPEQTVLYHGTTVHGVQSTDPVAAREPTAYFVRTGPLGDVMARLEERVASGRRVTVVGLGAGTIAAYAGPDDQYRFVEVDPLVVDIARDPSLFTYLSGAPTTVQVELDDGRLAIERMPDAGLDLLVLDAFASDVIPAHLLTVEALAEDDRVIAPTGLLAAQVSSRTYDLAPVIAAGLEPTGRTVLWIRYAPTDEEAAAGAIASEWVVAVDGEEDAAWFEDRGWQRVEPDDRPLTDDRADTLRLLRPEALL